MSTDVSRVHSSALTYLNMGLSVFPLASREKKPPKQRCRETGGNGIQNKAREGYISFEVLNQAIQEELQFKEEILAAALPANKGIDNRNTDRVFSIITMSTLCKAHLRQKVVFGGYTQIIATLEDLKEALLLMRNVTGIPTHKVNFYYDYILPLYKQKKKVASEGSKVYLTSREIADHYNEEAPKKEGGYVAKINTDAVSRTYLDELVTNSYLQKDEMPLDKRKYSYEPLVGFEEEEKEKEVNRARTQEKISKLSQLPFCDNFSQIPKLPLPRNYKDIPKNWLKIKIQSEKNCRSELTDFQIFRNLVSEEAVTQEQFIEEYEKTHKLFHFFENGDSGCGIETEPKTKNSTSEAIEERKEIIKNEEKEKEKLSQKGNCDNFDILNTKEDIDNLGDRSATITLCKEDSVAVDLEWDNRPGADDRLLQFNFKDHAGKKWVLNAKRDFNDSEADLLEAAVDTVRNYSVVFTYYEKGITLGFGVWDKRAKAIGKMSPIFMGYRKDGADSRIDLVNKKGFQMIDIDFGQIYEQPAIQNWLRNIYASNELGVVSQAILKRGKTEGVKGKDFPSLPLEVQVEYGIQDADLTFDLASNNKFLILEILDYLANFVEMPLEEVCNSGPNTWWESYYKNVMHVEPSSNAIKKNVGEKYEGGDVAKVKEVKEYRNVVVLDFKQQYPSLAKAKNVSFDTVNCGHLECANDQKAKIITGQPRIDTKGYYTCRKEKGSYPKALELLTELRDNYKAEYKKALAASDTEKAHEFDVKQNTMKIVSNTGYGVFGESHFAYGDVRTAEIITALGRTKVNKLEELIESDKFLNLTNIYRDTDSAFVLGIEGQLSKDNTTVKKIIQQANKLEEEGGIGIPLEYEKWYSKVLIYAAKNYMGVNGETGELVVKGLVGKKSNQCELVKDAFKQVREFWKNDVDNATIEAYIKPIIESLDNKTVNIEKLEEKSKIGYDPITGYENSPKRPEKVLGMKYNKRVNESITFWHKVKNGKDDYYFTENTAEIDYEHYKEPLRTALKPILSVRGYSAEQIDELLNITPKLSTKKPRQNCKTDEND